MKKLGGSNPTPSYKPAVTVGVDAAILVALGLAITAILGSPLW